MPLKVLAGALVFPGCAGTPGTSQHAPTITRAASNVPTDRAGGGR